MNGVNNFNNFNIELKTMFQSEIVDFHVNKDYYVDKRREV